MLTILSIRESEGHQRVSERKREQGCLGGRVFFLFWLTLLHAEGLLAGSSRRGCPLLLLTIADIHLRYFRMAFKSPHFLGGPSLCSALAPFSKAIFMTTLCGKSNS